eukprot:scpid61187/ scgid34036/ Replication protein A 70 kDa DNA-binding subunit; Replication factor A protein 1; Single-stranded DNA-binding protein
MSLTEGAVQALVDGALPQDYPNAVFQIVNVKRITTSTNQDRFRVMISDGKVTMPAMLGANIAASDELLNSVICAEQYLNNAIKGKRLLILVKMRVVKPGSEVGGRMGNPVNPHASSSSTGNGTASAMPAAPQGSVGAPSNGVGGVRAAPIGNGAPAPYSHQQPAQRATQGDMRVFPIVSLTPYQNRWTIRVRLTQKTKIKTWSNARGDGRVFSCDFLDDSGEIRATAFNQAVDKFYDLLEVDKMYYVSKGSLKPARKEFTSIKNEYEMYLNQDTNIELCQDGSDMPRQKYNFMKLSNLSGLNNNSLCDILGVVISAEELSSVTAKSSGQQITKRDLTIADDTGVSMRCTLWQNEAEDFDGTGNPIIVIKGAKKSDFNGCSVSSSMNSALIVNPDIPEAHQLRGWWSSEGQSMQFNSVSVGGGGGGGHTNVFKVLSQIKDENLGYSDKPDYFSTMATILYLKKDNCLYQACPADDCKKKVLEDNGGYRCEKCDKTYPDFKYRLLLSCNVGDFSSNQWVTSFNEQAELFLGKSAAELGELKSMEEEYDEAFAQATWKRYDVRVRAKTDTYQDETRVRCVCMSATPVDVKAASRRLIDEIHRLQSQ